MFPGVYAASAPERPAVVMGDSGEVLTYRELEDRSLRLARLLEARGLREGDRVAILAENHIRYFEVYWAALHSGLYLTTVNWHLAPDEAAYIVHNAGAKALVATATFGQLAEAMAPELPDCTVRLMIDGTSAAFEPYEDAIQLQPATPVPGRRRGDVMLYSSGTTGRPKAVRHPLPDVPVEAGGQVSALERTILNMDESTVYLLPAPLYHAAGLGWSGGVHELGGTVVLMEKFDAEQFLELVERHRVTHSQVVPTMLVRMLKLPEPVRSRYDLSSLRRIVHAAAPCPIEVKRAMIEWFGPIIDEYYSSTEGNGFTYITAAEWLTHTGSVGRAFLGTPHICDEAGNELPAGTAGLLYFERTDQSFEYYGDQDKTDQTQHRTHPAWTTLGDMGYLDDEGYLYLTDRKHFMIISGGVNIYPAEIEGCLVLHPAIVDVAVFGVPDPEMGESVQAVVQLADGVTPSAELAEELRTYARAHIAGYKVPRHIDFRDELPRLATGKLAKGPLRDEYANKRADQAVSAS